VVQARFVSILKTRARGAPNFKTKGRCGHLKFWEAKWQRLKDPSVFASDNRYQFVVKVSSLCVGEKFGNAFDLQHLQIFQEARPFKP